TLVDRQEHAVVSYVLGGRALGCRPHFSQERGAPEATAATTTAPIVAAKSRPPNRSSSSINRTSTRPAGQSGTVSGESSGWTSFQQSSGMSRLPASCHR